MYKNKTKVFLPERTVVKLEGDCKIYFLHWEELDFCSDVGAIKGITDRLFLEKENARLMLLKSKAIQ